MKEKNSEIQVVILCGGLGKRLRTIVSDRPKVMANINNVPFLDIVIAYVASFGFRKFILCVGHMSAIIKNYYARKETSLEITFSEERKPLGTGGALKNARQFIKSNNFLVMNGDTLCDLDYMDFHNFHKAQTAMLSMTVCETLANGNVGIISLDARTRIVAFTERSKQFDVRFSSAGSYFMNKSIFDYMPEGEKFSLEYDVFPNILNQRCFGYKIDGSFLDIGTPENFKKVNNWVKK